jgi:hypothetical protein
MKTIRTVLNRLISKPPATPELHFHRRGATPEACYDPRCGIPHLDV